MARAVVKVEMSEPHASEFRQLVLLGAGAPGVHPESGGRGTAAARAGYLRRGRPTDTFIDREQRRVETHRTSSCPILEAFAGRAERILDVGCSTGGSTVALALSRVLAPEVTVGVDPDPLSLRAAEVRARGHGLHPRRVSFLRNRPGETLPFGADQFDLVVCVSVLEFLPTAAARAALLAEMKRVVRPGGHLFLATPHPLRLRDLHPRRWLRELTARDGRAWSTSLPWRLLRMLHDWERVPVDAWVVQRALRGAGLPARVVPSWIARAIAWTGIGQRWQRVLARKPRR